MRKLPEFSTVEGSYSPASGSVEERRERGRAARSRVPRSAQATLPVENERADPSALIASQDEGRLQDLIPLRHQRMGESPFTFLRGAALVMADDLSRVPHSGLMTQICGDAHLSNFGIYAAPDRALVFDINDFDETAVGPFEWDVKRLAASVVVAARESGASPDQQLALARAVGRRYRTATAGFADMPYLETWYLRVGEADLDRVMAGAQRRQAAGGFRKARTRTSLHARDRMTTYVDGVRRFNDDAPLLVRITDYVRIEEMYAAFHDYRDSLPPDRVLLLSRYQAVDLARKVVGVGSVGLLAMLVLFEGRDERDPLILQIKQAVQSVVARYIDQPQQAEVHEGRRVVEGQRLLQTSSDIFLGWMTGIRAGRHMYWRQYRDMKGSFDVLDMRPQGLSTYAELCAWTLARAHARSGDPLAVSAYLGKSEKFDESIARWALAYADITTRDHAEFIEREAANR